jgi:hypothetical protein
MAEVEHMRELPRLLDRDDPPPLARLRWYWRYVHRWRKCLFHLWRREIPSKLDDTAIAPAVDDLIALALLLDYFRRSGFTGLPTILAGSKRYAKWASRWADWRRSSVAQARESIEYCCCGALDKRPWESSSPNLGWTERSFDLNTGQCVPSCEGINCKDTER